MAMMTSHPGQFAGIPFGAWNEARAVATAYGVITAGSSATSGTAGTTARAANPSTGSGNLAGLTRPGLR